MKARKLTPKQKRFVAEYQKDLNATAAAKRAGYSKKTAGFIGYENLKKPYIQKAIAAKAEKHLERVEITAENVVDEMGKLSFSNITDLVELGRKGIKIKDFKKLPRHVTAAISEVSQTKDGYIKFKLHSKPKSLEMLGRYFALFHDRLEVTGKLTLADIAKRVQSRKEKQASDDDSNDR